MDFGTQDNVDMLQCHNCQLKFSNYLELNEHMEICLVNLTDNQDKRKSEVFNIKVINACYPNCYLLNLNFRIQSLALQKNKQLPHQDCQMQ